MSKTYRGNKGSGFDYWGKRPMSGNGYGPKIKRDCKKTERHKNKQILKRGKYEDLNEKESF